MPRAEVEAIMGPPARYYLVGGSRSTCRQHEYVWEGVDGTISVTYDKLPEDEFEPYAPPGMENPLREMTWQEEWSLFRALR